MTTSPKRPQLECGIPHELFLAYAESLDADALAALDHEIAIYVRTGVMTRALLAALDEVLQAPLALAA